MSAKPASPRRTTMADVAAVARVHKSTVSLALRNQPSIPAATRERIQKLAAKLRYRPDPVLAAFNAQRLSRNPGPRQPTLAFVSDLPGRTAFDASERHREIFAGAAAHAARQGAHVELFFVGEGQLSAARLNRILHARGISGVILGALAPATASLPLAWDRLCGLAVESPHVSPALDRLATNYREAARLAVHTLRRETRARSIGFLLAPDLGAAVEDQLRAGYLVEIAARRGGVPLPFPRLSAGENASLKAWLDTHRPDAVVACGLRSIPRLPPAIAVASIDISTAQPHLPGVPAVHRALGQRAAETLALRLRANLRGLPTRLSTTLLPVSWRRTSRA